LIVLDLWYSAVIMTRNLFIVLEEERDGGYSASAPALPGCFSQGDTLDEAIKNAKEAIDLYLENEKKIKSNLPKSEILVSYQKPKGFCRYLYIN